MPYQEITIAEQRIILAIERLEYIIREIREVMNTSKISKNPALIASDSLREFEAVLDILTREPDDGCV